MAIRERSLTKSYVHQPGKVTFCGLTIGELFDKHVTLYPDHESFIFRKGNQRVSYSKLYSDMTSLSRGLKSLSLKQGDRIGIWRDESYEFVISSLACIRTGLIAVLIPLQVTKEKLCFVINKVDCTALIVGPEQYDVLQEMCPELQAGNPSNKTLSKLPSLRHVLTSNVESECLKGISLVSELASLMVEEKNIQEYQIRIDPDDICVIVFTSGSTGFPKAVAMSHRAIIEGSTVHPEVTLQTAAQRGEHNVRLIVSNPFTTKLFVARLCVIALSAVTLIIPEDKEASTLLRVIEEEMATVMAVFPHHVFDIVGVGNKNNHDLSSLQLCSVGGGIIPHDVLKKLSKIIPSPIETGYGTTESGYISFHSLDEATPLSVGYNGPNVEVKIDKDDKVADINTAGEVCVRSPFIFTCYWGDEEKTKAVKTSSGWYHTGDIGTMDETGCLRILGRKDDMIIKGAFNIYPAEIEQQLVDYPGVKYVQVVPVPDMKFGNELCLCLCEDSSTQSKREAERQVDILEYLKGRIPDFHMPKYVLRFESFPFTSSGKIQSKKLAKEASERLKLSDKC
ncbi:medium-chain acyl-CoA ligase ACSF2, mitochondrial-like [Glandiceps talaboti]